MASERAALEALNREYIRSVSESDVGWFHANLSEDFVNSNPDCSLLDRAGFLAQIGRGATVKNLDIEDVLIRELGDVALIHARTTYVKPDGQPGAGRYASRYDRGMWRFSYLDTWRSGRPGVWNRYPGSRACVGHSVSDPEKIEVDAGQSRGRDHCRCHS